MKTTTNKILCTILCAMAMLLCGCKEEKSNAPKILKMATSADYPPFEFYRDNQIVGFDVDLANILVETLGYKLEIVDVDFVGIIPALQSKKVDFAMSAINPTEARAKNIDFSEIYYYNDASFLYIEDGINDDLLNFRNKVLSAQLGSVFEDFLLAKQREFPSIKIHSLARIPLLIEELKLGRVDAILLDKQIADKVASRVKNAKTLEVSNFNFGAAIAFPKGNEALVEEFNSALGELIHNGKIAALQTKWFVNDGIEESSEESELQQGEESADEGNSSAPEEVDSLKSKETKKAS